jgi:hypothetical protein
MIPSNSAGINGWDAKKLLCELLLVAYGRVKHDRQEAAVSDRRGSIAVSHLGGNARDLTARRAVVLPDSGRDQPSLTHAFADANWERLSFLRELDS